MEHNQNRLSSQMSLDEESIQRMGSISGIFESKSMKNFSVKDEDFKKETKDKSSKSNKEKNKKESKKGKDAEKTRKEGEGSKYEKREEIKKKES